MSDDLHAMHPLFSGWPGMAVVSGSSSDWEEAEQGAWFPHHSDVPGHAVTPGTPGSAIMGGGLGVYGEGRGLTHPSTPRSGPMVGMDQQSSSTWGGFPHKNKVHNLVNFVAFLVNPCTTPMHYTLSHRRWHQRNS